MKTNNVSLPLDCISNCRKRGNLMIYNRALKNLASGGVEDINDVRVYIDLKFLDVLITLSKTIRLLYGMLCRKR